MKSVNKPNNEKSSKINSKIVYLFWLLSVVMMLVFGWSVFDNIRYASESVEIDATVYNKSSYRTRNANSRNYSTSLTVTYQFENPHIAGKMELVSELAPVMYALVEKGDKVKIYFNEAAKPKTRLSHLLHYWLMPVVWAVFLGFLFYISKLLARTNATTKAQYPLFFKILLLLFFLPTIYGVVTGLNSQQQLQAEKSNEESWPRWRALEHAVPKPEWWDEVPIKYFDPMNYTSDEYSYYMEQNTGADKYHRQFNRIA